MRKKQTLDGYEAAWSLTGTDRKISKLQQKAVDLLKSLFPSLPFCTEVKLPIYHKMKPKYLFGDIYLRYGVLIEVNGGQHDRPTPHFHKHRTDFDTLKQNEQLKQAWCDLNEITLVVLNHNETLEQWADKIKSALR